MTAHIEVILPKRFQERAMRREVGAGINNVIRGMVKDYENVTRTWRHKPDIEGEAGAQKYAAGTRATWSVYAGPRPGQHPEYDIFRYVDEGTRPHIIRPRRAKALAFVWGGPGSYRPKTQPMRLYSTAGGATGSLVFRRWVKHPGTKAREFTKSIERKWRALSNVEMGQAAARAAQASGHSYS